MNKINEETLAVIFEELNKKLDEVINKQKDLEKELKRNNKVIMQRINKVQEYNEIDDMRCKVSNSQLNAILKRIIELEERLY